MDRSDGTGAVTQTTSLFFGRPLKKADKTNEKIEANKIAPVKPCNMS